MLHHGKEKNDENFWMLVRTWTDSHPIREPLGASGFKGAAVAAVGEKPPPKKQATRT
jgi:hypothetical protein